jgi:hypothetical protein
VASKLHGVGDRRPRGFEASIQHGVHEGQDLVTGQLTAVLGSEQAAHQVSWLRDPSEEPVEVVFEHADGTGVSAATALNAPAELLHHRRQLSNQDETPSGTPAP